MCQRGGPPGGSPPLPNQRRIRIRCQDRDAFRNGNRRLPQRAIRWPNETALPFIPAKSSRLNSLIPWASVSTDWQTILASAPDVSTKSSWGAAQTPPTQRFAWAGFFGMEAEFWLNLQSHHDMELALDALDDRLDREVRPFGKAA